MVDVFIDPQIKSYLEQTGKIETTGNETSGVVMFTDLRNFTNFSGKVSSKQLASFLNNYYDIVIHHTQKHGGVVDKLMGDGAMCLFGIPTNLYSTAQKAVAAARDILRDFRAMILESHEPNLGLGIGLAYGNVLYGSFGNGKFVSFTVLGRTVNLAARIESLCTGRDILCNTALAEQLTKYETKPKGSFQLKGIAKAVQVHYVSETVPE